MAITAFPFDSDDTSEQQFSQLMGEAVDTGVVDAQGGTGFQVGVSGMAVTASAGTAVIRGFLGYTLGTEGPIAVANGHASLTRIDLAILRLDRAGNAMTFAVKQGTASSTPADPALTQTDSGIYEMPLARLTIPAGATTMLAGYITDLRQFVGSSTGAWTTAGRPTSPRKGKLGYNVTLSRWEFYLGIAGGDSGWFPLIPDTVNNSTKWNGYTLAVSPTTPAGTPTTDRIWIQPLA